MLKRHHRIVTGLLAAAVTCGGSDNGRAQTPEPVFDGRNASYELAAGSTLRRGDRLLDTLLVTVWQRTTVKGSGTCSAAACPIIYNGEEMFARRSRLTIAGPGARNSNTPFPPDRTTAGPTKDTVPYPNGLRRLQRGDKGDDVRRLQELLVRDGARLTPDGTYGRSTVGAIEDFQRRRGLTVDGIAGRATLKALGILS